MGNNLDHYPPEWLHYPVNGVYPDEVIGAHSMLKEKPTDPTWEVRYNGKEKGDFQAATDALARLLIKMALKRRENKQED